MSLPANGGYELVNGAWIHPGADIAAGVVLEPGVVIGDRVTIGTGTWVGAGAVIYGRTSIGRDNKVFPTSVLGGPPQDLGYKEEDTRLEIGDRNVFREGVTLNRGTLKGGAVTRIGSDCFLMSGSHVGHDSIIGDHVVLANDVLIAGHCHVGSHVNMAGGVAIVQFSTVGRFSFIGGLSGTTMDCEPFMLHDGAPARPMGINLVGLRRGQFSHKTIQCLKEAYRVIFTEASEKGGDNLDAVRKELESRQVLCPEVEELLGFMQQSRAGKFGRMLQMPLKAPQLEKKAE